MCLPTAKMCILNAPKRTKTDVFLYVYDLSHGVSSVVSEPLLGKYVEGIWHTAVVVFGSEYFFGVRGVRRCKPGALSIGKPKKKLLMGQTEFTEDEMLEFIQELANGPYKEGTYDLFEHNCIYFSEEVVKHLTGKSIPEDILRLPAEMLASPIGKALKPAVEGILQVMNRESQLVREIRRIVSGRGSNKHNVSDSLKRIANKRPA